MIDLNINNDIDNNIKNIVSTLAQKYNLTQSTFLSLFVKEIFCVEDVSEKITREDILLMLVIVSNKNLNPFAKEVYAAKSEIGNGYEAVLALNGWLRIMNNHPYFDGLKVIFSEQIETMNNAKPCPIWAECTIYRKDRQNPIVIREYLDEVYLVSMKDKDLSFWQTHTKRMFRHRVIEQCARVAFGFDKVYEPVQNSFVHNKTDTYIQKDNLVSNEILLLNDNHHASVDKGLLKETVEDSNDEFVPSVFSNDVNNVKEVKTDGNQVKVAPVFEEGITQEEIMAVVQKACELAAKCNGDFYCIEGFLKDKYLDKPMSLKFALKYAKELNT